jgi:hypothetical protein
MFGHHPNFSEPNCSIEAAPEVPAQPAIATDAPSETVIEPSVAVLDNEDAR